MKIKEASELTGKSRTALLRAIEKQKFSAEKDERGRWEIDPVTLSRYYEIKLPEDKGGAHSAHVRAHPNGAPRTGGGAHPDTPEIRVLEAELHAAKVLVEERGHTIEDLRSRLDHSEEKRSDAEAKRDEALTKLTALLTDQRTIIAPAPPPDAVPETSKPAKGARTRPVFWVILGGVVLLMAALFAMALLYPDALPYLSA